jgi:Glutathione S-transferase, N-terminal domain
MLAALVAGLFSLASARRICKTADTPLQGVIMALTLYHNDMSVCAQKVRLCLAEKQLAYEDRHLNLGAGDQKRPEYLAFNPNGYETSVLGLFSRPCSKRINK